jgi:hypothetical protein
MIRPWSPSDELDSNRAAFSLPRQQRQSTGEGAGCCVACSQVVKQPPFPSPPRPPLPFSPTSSKPLQQHITLDPSTNQIKKFSIKSAPDHSLPPASFPLPPSSTTATCSSSSCAPDTAAGAPVSRHCACVVFGKAMTSRMLGGCCDRLGVEGAVGGSEGGVGDRACGLLQGSQQTLFRGWTSPCRLPPTTQNCCLLNFDYTPGRPRQQHGQPVQPEREPAVWRSPDLEAVQEVAELGLGLLC